MEKIPLRGFRYGVGHMFRELGESFDKIGCFLQGSLAYKERLNRHRRVMNFKKFKPEIANGVFIAPSASVIGNVNLGENSSVWYNVVLRGDVNKITVGAMSNIQDRSIVHVSGKKDAEKETIIGNNVTIESGAIIHASNLMDECYIGIGATVLDGAIVEPKSMVAPGSVVLPGTVIKTGQLWAGVPAKFVRDLTSEEQASISSMASEFMELAKVHREECDKHFEEVLRETEEVEVKEVRLTEYRYDQNRTKQ